MAGDINSLNLLVLLVLMLYVLVNNFPVILGWFPVFLVLNHIGPVKQKHFSVKLRLFTYPSAKTWVLSA